MIYYTNNFKEIFLINYKCCFSSFDELFKNNKINKYTKKNYNELIKKIKEHTKIYFIIREPLNRLKSFYNDKFKYCFDGTYVNCDEQYCQKNMYKYFNKNKIKNLNFSFNDMVSCIKNGYKDGHIKLQCELLNNLIKKENCEIIKLEDNNFNNKIKSILGFELPRNNITKNKFDYSLTEENLKFIREFYKNDYILYNSH